MDDVRIASVDVLADDGLLDQWVEAGMASARHEFGERHTVYSADEVRARQREVTDRRIVLVAADLDGQVLGEGTLQAALRDNLHLANFWLSVRPEHRRRGVGSPLLQRLESLATSFGRTTFAVGSEVAAGRQDPATSFAATRGYAPALVELRGDLDLPPNLDALLEPLETDAAS